MRIKERLLNNCLEMFLRYGTKSISIDDITYQLGVSKKTFYQYFKNKEEAIKGIVHEIITHSLNTNKGVLEEQTDALEKLSKIYEALLLQFANCNPRFLFDLRKYNTEAYELLTEFRDTEFKSMIESLIRQGKAEGYFKKNIDEQLFFRLHLNRINAVIEGTLLPERNINDPLFFTFILMDLVGISTIEGHKKLEQKFKF